jgi:hypothetical protein
MHLSSHSMDPPHVIILDESQPFPDPSHMDVDGQVDCLEASEVVAPPKQSSGHVGLLQSNALKLVQSRYHFRRSMAVAPNILGVSAIFAY